MGVVGLHTKGPQGVLVTLEAGEMQERSLPRAFRERERERANLTLPTPVFQISSLQNQERIHFCSIFFFFKFLLFKTSSSWQFLQLPQEAMRFRIFAFLSQDWTT